MAKEEAYTQEKIAEAAVKSESNLKENSFPFVTKINSIFKPAIEKDAFPEIVND